MLEKFYPDLILDKVQDINMEMLKGKGIKGLILDIDNTLVPHGKDADEKAVEWVGKAKAEGFKICIVSNAPRKRVVKFKERLNVAAIYKASKPGRKAFFRALRLMSLKPSETAVVGDQIFTDVYGGNRLNMFTILVKPIDKKETFLIKLKRIAEKFVLSRYRAAYRKRENGRVLRKRGSVGQKHIR